MVATSAEVLPELARVHWRPRASDERLKRTGRVWTATTVAHTIPFIGGAVALTLLAPILAPVAVVLLIHAWAIPELYAARGAKVLRPRQARHVTSAKAAEEASAEAELVAMGLLGDLLDHRARELATRTGVAVERGRLGVWLLGQTGALLVRPGGRRVNCYCVKVPDASLPPSDRIAHLLLALRTDESGFATVANLSFSGARWRVRRRLARAAREALDVAAAEARLDR